MYLVRTSDKILTIYLYSFIIFVLWPRRILFTARHEINIEMQFTIALILKDLSGIKKRVVKKMWQNWTEITGKDHGHKIEVNKYVYE
jgi:uncharacterized membrane protein